MTTISSHSFGGVAQPGDAAAAAADDDAFTIRIIEVPISLFFLISFESTSGNRTAKYFRCSSYTIEASHFDKHIYGANEDAAFAIVVEIFNVLFCEQNIQEDYGMFVWPCSIVLAEYVWQERVRFHGKAVVEYIATLFGAPAAHTAVAGKGLTGTSHILLILQHAPGPQYGTGAVVCSKSSTQCLTLSKQPLDYWSYSQKPGKPALTAHTTGTSLPGLVAAKVGADVILTDNANRLEVLGLTWGEWDEPLFSLKPRIILGADVLYDAIGNLRDGLDLSDVSPQQMRPTLSPAHHWASLQVELFTLRGVVFAVMCSGHRFLEFLMVKWGLKCTKLVDAFSFMPSHEASAKCTNIQLVEIVLENE
ncbi:hypothetical protein ACLOJK_041820 [Asimina triloba]